MIWKVPKLAVYPSPVLRSPCSAIHLPRAHTRNTYSQHTCVRLSGPACLPSSSSYLLHVHLPASHLDRCVRPGPLPSVQDPRHSCHQFCRRGSARHTNPRCPLSPPPASYHGQTNGVCSIAAVLSLCNIIIANSHRGSHRSSHLPPLGRPLVLTSPRLHVLSMSRLPPLGSSPLWNHS
jgi:hypothetical protein